MSLLSDECRIVREELPESALDHRIRFVKAIGREAIHRGLVHDEHLAKATVNVRCSSPTSSCGQKRPFIQSMHMRKMKGAHNSAEDAG
jgi:hypothetical protein